MHFRTGGVVLGGWDRLGSLWLTTSVPARTVLVLVARKASSARVARQGSVLASRIARIATAARGGGRALLIWGWAGISRVRCGSRMGVFATVSIARLGGALRASSSGLKA